MKTIEWSFDYTDVDPIVWEKFCRELKIERDSVILEINGFSAYWSWKGEKVEVHTLNNPISGEYAIKGRRENEVGYASSIYLSGNEADVKKAARFIRMRMDSKSESPYEKAYL